jgi:hypothetical protein
VSLTILLELEGVVMIIYSKKQIKTIDRVIRGNPEVK